VSAADGALCGKCFQIEYDEGNHANDIEEAHRKLKGKIMIVLASNIGTDVVAGQFDIMILCGSMGNVATIMGAAPCDGESTLRTKPWSARMAVASYPPARPS
jgi:hypothetical protein